MAVVFGFVVVFVSGWFAVEKLDLLGVFIDVEGVEFVYQVEQEGSLGL